MIHTEMLERKEIIPKIRQKILAQSNAAYQLTGAQQHIWW
jgi:hypothetical protein